MSNDQEPIHDQRVPDWWRTSIIDMEPAPPIPVGDFLQHEHLHADACGAPALQNCWRA